VTENEIAKVVVDICFKIHRQYGPGLLESIYEELFCYELTQRGIQHTRQQIICLVREGVNMGKAFRADVIIENKFITELKSVEILIPKDFKQILSHLRITKIKLGMLVNFNVALIKDGIHRNNL
jgi:GxxExxY protein